MEPQNAPDEQVGTLHGILCHHAMFEFVCECDKCYKLSDQLVDWKSAIEMHVHLPLEKA